MCVHFLLSKSILVVTCVCVTRMCVCGALGCVCGCVRVCVRARVYVGVCVCVYGIAWEYAYVKQYATLLFSRMLNAKIIISFCF